MVKTCEKLDRKYVRALTRSSTTPVGWPILGIAYTDSQGWGLVLWCNKVVKIEGPNQIPSAVVFPQKWLVSVLNLELVYTP